MKWVLFFFFLNAGADHPSLLLTTTDGLEECNDKREDMAAYAVNQGTDVIKWYISMCLPSNQISGTP